MCATSKPTDFPCWDRILKGSVSCVRGGPCLTSFSKAIAFLFLRLLAPGNCRASSHSVVQRIIRGSFMAPSDHIAPFEISCSRDRTGHRLSTFNGHAICNLTTSRSGRGAGSGIRRSFTCSPHFSQRPPRSRKAPGGCRHLSDSCDRRWAVAGLRPCGQTGAEPLLQ